MTVATCRPTRAPTVADAVVIADRLATTGTARGILLFGSVARCDASTGSDIDLLVIPADESITPIPALPAAVSLIHRSESEVDALFADGWLFAEHLRREGRVLHDPGRYFERRFARPIPLDTAVKIGLQHERRRLAPYLDLMRFDGDFLFLLGRLHSIGKSLAMLRLAAAGAPVFARDRALEECASLDPALRTAVTIIRSLSPFAEHVARGTPLPSALDPTEERAAASLQAVFGLLEATG
jgi:predicted nucleotidyltransferase